MKIAVERNGVKTEVTKKQLFALAAEGSITPETKLWVNDREITARKVQGIVFKNKETFALPQEKPQTMVSVPPSTHLTEEDYPKDPPHFIKPSPPVQIHSVPIFKEDKRNFFSSLKFKYFIIKPGSVALWWIFFAASLLVFICMNLFVPFLSSSKESLEKQFSQNFKGQMDENFPFKDFENPQEDLLKKKMDASHSKKPFLSPSVCLTMIKIATFFISLFVFIYIMALVRILFELIYLAGDYYLEKTNPDPLRKPKK